MSDIMEEKIKNYRTAPFDARFPNTNQTRNCFQNYLGKQDNLLSVDQGWELMLSVPYALLITWVRCNKALSAKDQDTAPCQWYQRVYKSLCPISWVQKWDEQVEMGNFPGKI